MSDQCYYYKRYLDWFYYLFNFSNHSHYVCHLEFYRLIVFLDVILTLAKQLDWLYRDAWILSVVMRIFEHMIYHDNKVSLLKNVEINIKTTFSVVVCQERRRVENCVKITKSTHFRVREFVHVFDYLLLSLRSRDNDVARQERFALL